jgi:putative component of membrane protein insertase Oxa1/YidC/SpoIIIJ protein YidD
MPLSFLLILYFAQLCSLDKPSELAFIMSSNPIVAKQNIKNANSGHLGFHSIFTGTIRLYQLFISTQDKPVCNFVPSCSHFGASAIREFGISKGILLTSDRLQRCNGISVPYYEIDYSSGKLIDPVQNYADLTQKQRKK